MTPTLLIVHSSRQHLCYTSKRLLLYSTSYPSNYRLFNDSNTNNPIRNKNVRVSFFRAITSSNNNNPAEDSVTKGSKEETSNSSLLVVKRFSQFWKNIIVKTINSTRRTNPILEDIFEITMGVSNSTTTTNNLTKKNDRPIFYPKFNDIKPYHFSEAFEIILSQTMSSHQEMEDMFRDILVVEAMKEEEKQEEEKEEEEEGQLPSLLPDINGIPFEDVVLQNLYRIHFPTYFLRNLLGLYMQVNQVYIRRDRKAFQNLLLVQSKLRRFNTVLTPTNTSLLLLTMEHVKEKQKQLLSSTTVTSSSQQQIQLDELERKRRALELILERENTVRHIDDNNSTEQELENGNEHSENNSKEEEENEYDDTQIIQALKDLSIQLRRKHPKSQQQPHAAALTKIYELLNLRKRKANMLGYESYAELYTSKNMMIQNCQEVSLIHTSIAEKAIPVALRNMERRLYGEGEEENSKIKVTKAVRTASSTGSTLIVSSYDKPEVWDKLSTYLEFESVLKGMFELSRRLFGVVIKEVEVGRTHQVWDRDVRIFQLYDEDNEMKYLASFYLDPYRRPENKTIGENMCISLVDGAIQAHTTNTTAPPTGSSTSTSTTSSIRTSPLVSVICDIHPPDWSDSPCLLSFEDATNLFHEFGHALHKMLSTADVGFVAGTNGVETDAVEFPSQFLPLWLYDKGTLTSFGEHYQTGEQIPDELFDELIKERLNRSSLRLLNQVFQGQLELELYDTKHSNQSVLQILEDCSNQFVLPSTKNKNRKEVDLLQVIDIFVDGTPEFRYRYLVSEIMSCDAFAAFEEVGLSNDASVKVLGRKFRKMILATGGGLKASDAYHRFRGRDFQTDAFFRHNGLV